MDAGPAAVSLLRLLGLLDGNGVVEWAWFGAPGQRAKAGLAGAEASTLDGFFQAVTGIAPEPFDVDVEGESLRWIRLGGGTVGVGPVWRGAPSSDALLAIGATLTVASKDLGLVVRVIDADGDDLALGVGTTRFKGQLPAPEFLDAASVGGGTGPFEIGFTANAPDVDQLTLEIETPTLLWDTLRMATYVFEAWLHHEAQSGPEGVVTRLDRHLPAMLGKPAAASGLIAPSPPYQSMRSVGEFDGWVTSVVSGANNAQGALTFLWHLRALLTGNDSARFLDGSLHFPFTLAGPPEGDPPTGAELIEGPPPTSGLWFAVTWSDPQIRTLCLCIGHGDVPILIPLVSVDGDQILRPAIESEALNALQDGLLAGSVVNVSKSDGVVTLAFGDLGPFGSQPTPAYAFELHLTAGKPVDYVVRAGSLGAVGTIGWSVLTSHPEVLLRELTLRLLEESTKNAPDDAKQFLAAIESLIEAGEPQAATVANVISGLIDAVGGAGLDPFEVTMAGTVLTTSVEIGPIVDGSAFGVDGARIGRVAASLALDLAGGGVDVERTTLSLTDLRLSPSGIADARVAGSLIPDLREVPGFNLRAEWQPGTPPVLVGGGRLPIQQTLGPVTVSSLLIDVATDSVAVGVDLGFELGPIAVAATGLGLRYRFATDSAEVTLDGLGLSMDTSLFTLAGMFGAVGTNGHTDYVGGASVSVAGLFELAAIGGYTQIDGPGAETTDSLFLFASLTAPLGGTPWFFVTGVAGGFGFNRALPSIDLLFDHPFLQVMDGKIDVTGGASDVLATLSENFTPRPGAFWVAGGVQFVSFGFIQGKIVLQIGFGKTFSVSVIGVAEFSVAPIAHFELVVAATADEDHFEVRAGLTNSYLIHPDVFGLQGGFALAVWYGGTNAGDFVLSIGGYHPYFPRPGHYPELDRVSVKASVFGFVRLSVECFFAVTPQAIMAGASISLAAEFAGIGVGLDLSVDMLVMWDPPYLCATMTITVWFEFLGRHEISVELVVRTPPFGGLALVDLALVSFEVEFGELAEREAAPEVAEFVAHQLGVLVTREQPISLAPFDDGHDAGLFRVDVVDGRSALEKGQVESEPLLPGTTTSVSPSFAFAVRTRLPIDVDVTLPADATALPITMAGSNAVLQGDVSLPLCVQDPEHETTLTVTIAAFEDDMPVAVAEGQTVGALPDVFPAAEFGGPLTEAQSDDVGARQVVASVKTDDAARVALFDTFEVRYSLSAHPALLDMLAGIPGFNTGFVALESDTSDGPEVYPLPLGPSPQFVGGVRKLAHQLSVSGALPGVHVVRAGPHLSRRDRALASVKARPAAALHIVAETAPYARRTARRLPGSPAAVVPAGVAVGSPPPSPPRRPELFDVRLQIVPDGWRSAARTIPTSGSRRPSQVRRSRLTPEVGTIGPARPTVAVPAGSAVCVDLAGTAVRDGTVTVTGDHQVRMLALAAGGAALTDAVIPPGRSGQLPRGTRGVALIPQPGRSPLTLGRVPMATEPIGVDHGTSLLALGRGVFAGHGCVVQLRKGSENGIARLTTLTGLALLRTARALQMTFPAVAPVWALVITVEPRTADAASPLERIRWRSSDARFSDLHTVVTADRVAFIMAVAAPESWSLELEVDEPWRLAGVAVRQGAPSDIAERLTVLRSWELVDDRLHLAGRGIATVTMEVNR